MVSKSELRPIFEKDWEKHYKVQFLVDSGFQRKACSKCKRHYWTLDQQRTLCNDPSCEDYSFIGEKTSKRQLSYIETWKEIEKYFQSTGHTSINRYPVTARWRDDLFFTSASIIGFQPYVVSGEIEPPANPLVVPQRCLRFNDIPNVGVTGRHMTNFVMIGQHAFNNEKTGMFYWKNEVLEHDFNILTKVLGIAPEKIVFREDAWAGGGNFGPCIEYFVHGLEIGNAVFMQFADPTGELKDSYEQKMKVVDMGAGLERFTWINNGTPTAYDAVYGDTLAEAKRQAGLKVDHKLFTAYSKLAGRLDFEEVGQESVKGQIAQELGVDKRELFGQIEPLQAIYAVIDHLGTVMYTTTDGTLPSNTGAGYYLRYVLRRAFSLKEENNLDLDFARLVETHARYLKPLNPELLEFVPTICDLLEVEKRKYDETMSKGRVKVLSEVSRLSASGVKVFPEPKLVELYESHGVPVELVRQIVKREGAQIEVPEINIEAVLKKKPKGEDNQNLDCAKTPRLSREVAKTRFLFYEDSKKQYEKEFDAKLLALEGNAAVLDQTLFYAEGGGQEADKGVLIGERGETEVLDVQKSQGVAFHFVKEPQQLLEGEKVHGIVDWKRREKLMTHHSANHVLLASAKKVLGEHVWQTGTHKAEDKGHIDLTHFRRITPEEIAKIEEQANGAVERGYECEVKWIPRGEAEKEFGFTLYQGGAVPGKELRVVNFKGWDAEACGGTHVRNSRDIKLVKVIKRIGVQDGRERLEYVAGNAAVEWMRKTLQLRVSEAVALMEKLPEGLKQKAFNEVKALEDAVLKFNESQLVKLEKPSKTAKDFDALESRLFELREKLEGETSAALKEQEKNVEKAAKQMASQLWDAAPVENGAKIISAFLDGVGVPLALNVAKELSLKEKTIAAIACTHPKPFAVVLSSPGGNFDALKALQFIASECNGKGGGKANFAQASVSDKAKLKELLEGKKWLGQR